MGRSTARKANCKACHGLAGARNPEARRKPQRTGLENRLRCLNSCDHGFSDVVRPSDGPIWFSQEALVASHSRFDPRVSFWSALAEPLANRSVWLGRECALWRWLCW